MIYDAIEAPVRSDDQRLAALDQANRVRSARAHLKRSIRRDPEDARRVLADPRVDYRSMRLRDLLLALPRVGDVKVDRFLLHARVSPTRTLAGLSERQREAALDFVSDYIARRREAA